MLGVDWKTFNTDQKQARKGMALLYATKRPLLQGRLGLAATEHSFAPMFTIQV